MLLSFNSTLLRNFLFWGLAVFPAGGKKTCNNQSVGSAVLKILDRRLSAGLAVLAVTLDVVSLSVFLSFLLGALLTGSACLSVH